MMKLLTLMSLFLLFACGKKQDSPPLLADKELTLIESSQEKNLFSYLELSGFDDISNEEKRFRVNLKSLESINLEISFDEKARQFLKEHFFFWQDPKITFVFQEDFSKSFILRTSYRSIKKKSFKKKLTFSLEKDEWESLWKASQSLTLMGHQDEKYNFPLPLSLKEKNFSLNQNLDLLNSSFYLKNTICTLRHYFTALTRAIGKYEKIHSFQYRDENYGDCSQYLDRIQLKNETRIIRDLSDFYFILNNKPWHFSQGPAKPNDELRHYGQIYNKNQILSFAFTLQWLE